MMAKEKLVKNKIYVVTQTRLDSALAVVRAELRLAGLWTTQLDRIPVRLSRAASLGFRRVWLDVLRPQRVHYDSDGLDAPRRALPRLAAIRVAQGRPPA
jgi:hypothetical protein